MSGNALVVAFLGALQGHRIGLFLSEGVDEQLGLAVAAGRVRPSAGLLEGKGFAGLGKAAREGSGTVIRNHFAAFDAMADEPGDSTTPEADRCSRPLVRWHFNVFGRVAKSIAM